MTSSQEIGVGVHFDVSERICQIYSEEYSEDVMQVVMKQSEKVLETSTS